MKKIICLALLILGIQIAANAQDKIFRKNGSIITCKIIEIGTDDIKYVPNDNLTGPTYSIAKDNIKYIVFANGKKESYEVSWKDHEQYSDQLKHAIKIDFFAPLLGYSQISYEKNVGVGKAYEIGIGIIGLGTSAQLNYYNTQLHTIKKKQVGAFISAGYKFNKLPEYLFGKTRFTHIMQGSYAKPILYVGNYAENRIAFKGNSNYEVEKQNITFAALQIELGKQWIFADKFLLDGYFGIGYATDNKRSSNDWDYSTSTDLSAFNYANIRLGKTPSISFTFGVKLGLLIK